jgi:tetratricopeptide (TPR) repeat protein
MLDFRRRFFATFTRHLRICLSLVVLSWGIALMAPTAAAQSPDSLLHEGIELLERGQTRGDVETLQQARATFERVAQSNQRTALAHYYVGLADYQIVNLVDESRQSTYLDDAQKNLTAALDARPEWTEAWALLSSVYGRKAAGGMRSGMRYGPKANDAMEKARELGPNNPRVLLMDGISYYNKPSMFGGDDEKAVELLKEAVRQFESASARNDESSTNSPSLEPSWGHADAHVWLGIIYAKDDRSSDARTHFERALEIRPNYAWVEQELLPNLASR